MTKLRWAVIVLSMIAGPSTALAQNRPVKRPTDLLKKLSLPEASASGSWIRTAEGGVRSGSTASARLRLGRAPEGEYDVVVVFTRQEGEGRLGILLSYDGTDFGWFIGEGRDMAAGGFALVDERGRRRSADSSLPTIPADAKKRTVRFKVRREGVTAWLGKKKIGEVTDYYDLALDDNDSVGEGAIGLLSDRSSILVHAISLTPYTETSADDEQRVEWREKSEQPVEDETDVSIDILPFTSTWNGFRTTLNRHGDIHCNMKVVERNGPIVVMRMTERGGFSTRWTFSLKRGNLTLERCTQEGGAGSISEVLATGAVSPGRLRINYQWVYSGPRAARAIIVGAIYLEED